MPLRVAPLVVLILVAFGCKKEPGEHTPPADPTTSPTPDTTPPDTTPPTTTTPPSTTTDPFLRPVVLPAHPLALENTQQDVLTWPLWGGAFSIGEAVSIRASLDATGIAGLVVAGPGTPWDRVGFELVSDDGWRLRETAGGEIVQEVAVEVSELGDFVLDLTTDGVVTVTGELGAVSMTLQAPLGDDGTEAGLYVTIDPGAVLAIDDIAMTAAFPTYPELGTALRDLAPAHGIEIGTATDIWPPVHDLGLESLQGHLFGTIAPTEFYWPTTRGEDDDYHFVPADLMVNYANVHGQLVTGMFLVWDFALPYWVVDLANSGDTAAIGAAYDDHVTTLASRYRGTVDAWVVVNEAIWGPEDVGGNQARFAQTLWYDALGPEHIERAFTVADAADPDAVLMYNETGAEELNLKSDFMYDMAADFLARGIPIDAVGLQFHVHADDPPDLASVQANMERFADLGLDVYITELDVSLEGTTLPEADALDLQAQLYADILETCLAVPACRSYTVFGFSDRYAWDELGDATPLLFDEDYVAKPAYFAVQDVLQ